MKKMLIVLMLSLCCFLNKTYAEDMHLLVRINQATKDFLFPGQEKSEHIPTKLGSPELSKKLASLKPDDEVLLTGHLEMHKISSDGRSGASIFIITDIRPISLQRLGQVQKLKMPEKEINFEKVSYAPHRLTLPNTVAGSVIMTASVLLLHSIAMAGAPQVQQDINNGLIFSAGALATGLFINDEIKIPEKNPGQN